MVARRDCVTVAKSVKMMGLLMAALRDVNLVYYMVAEMAD